MEVVCANKMKEMEGRVADASCKLIQCTFSTFYEVKAWCEENQVSTNGTFWDLFSVLAAMKSPSTKPERIWQMNTICRLRSNLLPLKTTWLHQCCNQGIWLCLESKEGSWLR
jgi:hypothetical protein